MVLEQTENHASRLTALKAIAPRIGVEAEMLRNCVLRFERDKGKRSGPTLQESTRIKQMERENFGPWCAMRSCASYPLLRAWKDP